MFKYGNTLPSIYTVPEQGGGVSIREQRSRARSRRGGVSENWIAGSAAAQLFFLTAIAIAIATRPFKFHENSVSYTSSSFVSSIHSFAGNITNTACAAEENLQVPCANHNKKWGLLKPADLHPIWQQEILECYVIDVHSIFQQWPARNYCKGRAKKF